MSEPNPQPVHSIKSDFTFLQLFKDFHCKAAELYVFDNVSIQVDPSDSGAGKNTVSFSGKLRMKGTLAKFKDFLRLADNPLVTGKFLTAGDLTTGIRPQSVTLTASLSFHHSLFHGVTLTSVLLHLDFTKSGNEWQITPTLRGNLAIDNLTDDKEQLSFTISDNDGGLELAAAGNNIKGAFGLHHLLLETLSVKGQIGSADNLTLSAALIAGNTTFSFDGLVTPQAIAMIASETNFTTKDLANIFSAISPAGLTLPDFPITFAAASLALATADCTLGDNAVKKGLTLSSTMTAHGHSLATSAQISTNGVVFEGSFADLKIGSVDIKEAGLDFQIFRRSVGKPALFKIHGRAEIEDVDVDCGVYFEKQVSSWTTVLYAILQAKTLSLSTVFPETKGSFVDELKFSKAGFIYASGDCTTQKANLAFTVREGLQLVAIVEEIPGLSKLLRSEHTDLALSAHFGEKTDISIAIPSTTLDLGHLVHTDPAQIRIELLPEPSLALVFGMAVDIPHQSKPLHFDMVLDLGPAEAKGSVTMKNYWNDPFGISGLRIGPELALELDIIYDTFLETGPAGFGIAGGMAIGDTSVDMAVKLSENPTEEILSGSIESLDVKEVIEFANNLIELNVPANDIPDFFELRKLKLYVAPTGGTIGTIVYKQGFSFSCDLVIGGKEIAFYARVSDTGIEGRGHIDQLEFGALKIGGEEGRDAMMNLALTEAEQVVTIDGRLSFLGVKEGVFVDISNKGIAFKFEQIFKNLLTFQVEGQSSGAMGDPASLDFQLSADMDSKITDFLKTEVSSKVNTALKTTEHDIHLAQDNLGAVHERLTRQMEHAHEALSHAQEEADAYLSQLNNKVVEATDRYRSDIDVAQNRVVQAKATYDYAFSKAQDAVSSAEDDYNSALDNAQSAVKNAKNEYNTALDTAKSDVSNTEQQYNNAIGSAQGTVNSANRKIESLLTQIDKKQRQYKRTSCWHHPVDCTEIRTEQAALVTAYGTAKAALATANVALEAVKYGGDYTAFESAKAGLQGVKTGAKYTAWQAAQGSLQAVKTGAKYAAFESAKVALTAVKTGTDYTAWQGALQALSQAKATGQVAIDEANGDLAKIGQSTAYVALNAAKTALKAVENGPAAAAFSAARTTLEAARTGSEDLLGLSNYIAHHSGDLIDVKRFHISGSLKEIEQGKLFNANLDVVVLGHEDAWQIDLHIKDVDAFIENVYRHTLEVAKSIVGIG